MEEEKNQIAEDILSRLDSLNKNIDGLIALAKANKARHLQIAVIPFPTANTEVIWKFPLDTKRFTMHTRGGSAVRIANAPGLVAGSLDPYFTLKSYTAYSDEDLNIEDFTQTFYLACAVAGETLEIIMGV
jgi:hypothetical protein